MAAGAIKIGKATDASGLSNACIKGLKGDDAISCIADLIQGSGKTREGYPAHSKTAQGLLQHRKEDRETLTNY